MRAAPGGNPPVRTVLLDLDGTLMDHVGAARAALDAWLGERGTASFVDAWFTAEERRIAEWRSGAATWQEQRRRRLRDVLPLLGETPGTDEQLDRLFEDEYLAGYRASWRAFSDAAPALEELRSAGFGLAVLTNGAGGQQRAKLAAIGLADTAGPVFTADGIGAAKPDPRAFRTACQRLGADPGSVLYVGDEHEVDVLGARAAGLQAVLLDRTGTAPPGEHAVIASLRELPGLLRP